MKETRIVGILNITPDSFSDAGLYLDPATAVRKAKQLAAEGADWIDLGAESSNPKAAQVPAETEIARLEPVVRALKTEGLRLSVDTYKPAVMRAMLQLGVDMINDITALRSPEAVEMLREAGIPVVIMHSRAEGPHADRREHGERGLMDRIHRFFDERITSLRKAGIKRENILIDPGMGFFLDSDPEPSLTVLKNLGSLKKFGVGIYLSTSRKSFIGTTLNRDLKDRAAGTLATEIWAFLQGVDFLRTHEVRPLRDAIRMLKAIQDADAFAPDEAFRQSEAPR